MQDDRYSYKTFFRKLYKEQKQQFIFSAQDVSEAELWKTEFRKTLREALGLNYLEHLAAKDPVSSSEESEAVLLWERQMEGYRCRKYEIQTLPEVRMPFQMLIPDGTDSNRPAKAMLTIPAHGANKNTVCGIAETETEREKIQNAPHESYGAVFVKKGYIVFCPDPPGYGERVERLSQKGSINSLGNSCRELSQTAEALGFSLTALEIWDLERLLDFACACPEVEKREGIGRIGCAGFSGGGQYAMWLAALDDRICLAVVSGYLHGYHESILECHLCPCNYAPNLWLLGDICDICSLIVPRPLFLENGIQDPLNGSLGIEGPLRQAAKIRHAYEVYNASGKLVHATPPGGHQWYGLCYDFVDENL